MSDIFESTVKKYRGSPVAVVLFVAAFTMFVIGANHFAEDTVSSKIGLESLQMAYNLKVQIFDWSYWTMSLAPQVASIVFFYMYLSDTSRRAYLYMSLAAQGADFFADSWYRSNGMLFDNGMVFTISSILTFVYFSVGSEMFLTISSGLMLKLAAPAIQTWKVALANIAKANNMAFNPDGGGGDKGKGGGGDGERKHIPFPESLPRGSSSAQMSSPKPNGGTGPLSPISRENRGNSDKFRR